MKTYNKIKAVIFCSILLTLSQSNKVLAVLNYSGIQNQIKSITQNILTHNNIHQQLSDLSILLQTEQQSKMPVGFISSVQSLCIDVLNTINVNINSFSNTELSDIKNFILAYQNLFKTNTRIICSISYNLNYTLTLVNNLTQSQQQIQQQPLIQQPQQIINNNSSKIYKEDTLNQNQNNENSLKNNEDIKINNETTEIKANSDDNKKIITKKKKNKNKIKNDKQEKINLNNNINNNDINEEMLNQNNENSLKNMQQENLEQPFYSNWELLDDKATEQKNIENESSSSNNNSYFDDFVDYVSSKFKKGSNDDYNAEDLKFVTKIQSLKDLKKVNESETTANSTGCSCSKSAKVVVAGTLLTAIASGAIYIYNNLSTGPMHIS